MEMGGGGRMNFQEVVFFFKREGEREREKEESMRGGELGGSVEARRRVRVCIGMSIRGLCISVWAAAKKIG